MSPPRFELGTPAFLSFPQEGKINF